MGTDTYSDLGRKIARRRKALDLSQDAVAEALNVSRSAVGNWEIGRAMPASDHMRKLASVLQMDLNELLSGGRNAVGVVVSDPPYGKTAIDPAAAAQLAKRRRYVEARRGLGLDEVTAAQLDALLNEDLDSANPKRNSDQIAVRGRIEAGGGLERVDETRQMGLIPRPPNLHNIEAAIALVVNGDALAPEFRRGDHVYLDPLRPPAIGAASAIWLVDGAALLRYLVEIPADLTGFWRMRAASGEPFAIPAAEVRRVDRVAATLRYH